MPAAATAPTWLTEVAFAHRGLHDRAAGVPENSLPAFAAAVDAGYGIELDVHATRDGVPVVVHDDRLGRVTGHDGRITRTVVDALADLRLLGTSHAIPHLAQALDTIAGRVPLMVEIKPVGGRVGAAEAAIRDLLRGYAGPVCVASFDPRTVAWFHRHAPDVVRGQTAAHLTGAPLPRVLKRWLAGLPRVEATDPHFVSYALDGLPNRATDRWRGAGRPLIAWTVRTSADLDHARKHADNWIFETVDTFVPAAP